MLSKLGKGVEQRCLPLESCDDLRDGVKCGGGSASLRNLRRLRVLSCTWSARGLFSQLRVV